MSAGVEFTPVDQETGIVYPVLVTPKDFYETKNRQHHADHPASRLELQDEEGGAERSSRTQQLPNVMHLAYFPGSYHDIFWGPENLPRDSHGKITKALLHIGNVIPRKAIVLSGDGYGMKDLTEEEHAFLSTSFVTHVEGNTPRKRQFSRNNIGNTLISYALKQELEEIASRKSKERFLQTLDIGREKELGNLMIQNAVELVVEPRIAIHERAREDGMVDPSKLSLRSVVRNFLYKGDFGNYYGILRQRLTAELEEAEIITLQTGVDDIELVA